MFITREDFKIKAANFNLLEGQNIIRIICGLFLLPHAHSKISPENLFALNQGTIGFFEKAGFAPGEIWVTLAFFAELLSGLALILGICTRWAGIVAGVVLLMAVYALQTLKGFSWLWNKGGYEYPVFWAICCFAVALMAFREHARKH